jgi:hypothetical protein
MLQAKIKYEYTSLMLVRRRKQEDFHYQIGDCLQMMVIIRYPNSHSSLFLYETKD